MQPWNEAPRQGGTPTYGGAGYGGPGYGSPNRTTAMFGTGNPYSPATTKHVGARPMLGGIFERARPPGAASACRTLAYFSTLTQLCLYAAPVILCLQMAMDPDVVYWIGGFGQWAVVVPFYCLLLHVIHVKQIAANTQTRAIFALMIIPMICLAILGLLYHTPAARVKSGLFFQ